MNVSAHFKGGTVIKLPGISGLEIEEDGVLWKINIHEDGVTVWKNGRFAGAFDSINQVFSCEFDV